MDDLPVVKKSRKRARKGKKADSIIQPPQEPRLQDRIDIPDADKWHIPGQPILHATALQARFGDLRRLHDDVLRVEKGLIASKDPGYPLYVVNVPRQMSYVNSFPADKFFLRIRLHIRHVSREEAGFYVCPPLCLAHELHHRG